MEIGESNPNLSFAHCQDEPEVGRRYRICHEARREHAMRGDGGTDFDPEIESIQSFDHSAFRVIRH